VAAVVGFHGTIEWDPSKPDGTPRKCLDVSRLTGMGWHPRVCLEDGIAVTYRWYLDNVVPR
jgi:GDP-L-fucose synthase